MVSNVSRVSQRNLRVFVIPHGYRQRNCRRAVEMPSEEAPRARSPPEAGVLPMDCVFTLEFSLYFFHSQLLFFSFSLQGKKCTRTRSGPQLVIDHYRLACKRYAKGKRHSLLFPIFLSIFSLSLSFFFTLSPSFPHFMTLHVSGKAHGRRET